MRAVKSRHSKEELDAIALKLFGRPYKSLGQFGKEDCLDKLNFRQIKPSVKTD